MQPFNWTHTFFCYNCGGESVLTSDNSDGFEALPHKWCVLGYGYEFWVVPVLVQPDTKYFTFCGDPCRNEWSQSHEVIKGKVQIIDKSHIEV